MKLAKRTLLPPCLDLLQCYTVFIWTVVFDILAVSNKEEGLSGEVNNMALAAKSMRSRIVFDIKFAKQAYKDQLPSKTSRNQDTDQEKGISS